MASNDYNQQVIAEFRANGGVVGGRFTGTPLLLLTTTGAKSGQPRISPLSYFMVGEQMVVFAAAAGAPHSPAWYHNLVAHPAVTLEVGTETFPAQAIIAEGQERERLVNHVTAQNPWVAEFQHKTTRVIPVVVLERRGA